MFRLLWVVSVHIRSFLRRYMPTNILLDAIRTRRGLKWGVPAMFLALPYLLAASICSVSIADGGSGWLNVLVLLFVWNALKFTIMGPISLALLVRAKASDLIKRQRQTRSEADGVGPATKVHARRAGAPS